MLHPVPGLGLALGTADPPGLAIPGQGSDVWCDTGQRVPAQAALICSPVVPPSQEHSLIQNTPRICSRKMQHLLQKLLPE